MFGFAGWNFIGASSAVLRDAGGNIVLNMFFGPSVNAARGIANQVNNAITGFVQNFMTALNPQITKSYASGDREYMMTLIFKVLDCLLYASGAFVTSVNQYALYIGDMVEISS